MFIVKYLVSSTLVDIIECPHW